MQTSNSNQNSLATFAKVCSLICTVVLIITSLGLTSCNAKKPTPAKHVEVKEVQKTEVKKDAPKGWVIRYIDADGWVLLGPPEFTPLQCKTLALDTKSPVYKLRGIAKVGDPAEIITQVEKRLLSSGEVKILAVGHYVQSTRRH